MHIQAQNDLFQRELVIFKGHSYTVCASFHATEAHALNVADKLDTHSLISIHVQCNRTEKYNFQHQ